MRTRAPRRLESQASVLVLIVIPAAVWTVALALIFADRLRPLFAALPAP